MFRAVVQDSIPTRIIHVVVINIHVVVINDADTPGVERVERSYRGFDVVIPSMVCDSGALRGTCQ